MENQFDYIQFLKDRIDAQQEYAEAAGIVGPKDPMTNDTRHKKVIEFLGHLVEEVHEARALVPRRSWKTTERSFLEDQSLYDAFIAEMYDLLLFHGATLAYAGVDPDYFYEIVKRKNQYNAQRTDHNKNLPKEIRELHGDCESSEMRVICENPDEELTGESLDQVIND
ncbi:MAG: hypothetical protein R3321_04095 [Nitrososphaeraceae archaeon]|nr:hypothetical protein [Nitrososphaeraceae archaeon]